MWGRKRITARIRNSVMLKRLSTVNPAFQQVYKRQGLLCVRHRYHQTTVRSKHRSCSSWPKCQHICSRERPWLDRCALSIGGKEMGANFLNAVLRSCFFTQRRVNVRYYDTRLLFAFMICRRYSLLLVVQNYSLSKWRRGKVGLWNGWVKMQNYT